MSGIRVAVGAVVIAAAVMAVGCGSGEPEGERAPSASSPAVQGMDITLRTTPDPVRMGDNTLEVAVREGGKPVTDATVSTEFYMAAMPSMNMPEMRSKADLTHAGNGLYRGQGQVSMAGSWDVTVTVMRGGQEIGSKKMTLTAK
jgi:hypothetical protein